MADSRAGIEDELRSLLGNNDGDDASGVVAEGDDRPDAEIEAELNLAAQELADGVEISNAEALAAQTEVVLTEDLDADDTTPIDDDFLDELSASVDKDDGSEVVETNDDDKQLEDWQQAVELLSDIETSGSRKRSLVDFNEAEGAADDKSYTKLMRMLSDNSAISFEQGDVEYEDNFDNLPLDAFDV
mmetsp:Transcript_11595/g.35432  ORF Transcript_11595/g.35432 Transcript_11595/m.35432 type:complete len:187 (-) Transcript_11595:128-688(-)